MEESQLSAFNFLLAAFRPLRWSPETVCSSPEPGGPGRWRKVWHLLLLLPLYSFNHWIAVTHTSLYLLLQTTWPRLWSSWVKFPQMWPFPAGTLPSTSTAEVGRTETNSSWEVPASHSSPAHRWPAQSRPAATVEPVRRPRGEISLPVGGGLHLLGLPAQDAGLPSGEEVFSGSEPPPPVADFMRSTDPSILLGSG